MSVKLLTKHLLEVLSLKEAAQAGLSLHLSKFHIVGNHMQRFIAKTSPPHAHGHIRYQRKQIVNGQNLKKLTTNHSSLALRE